MLPDQAGGRDGTGGRRGRQAQQRHRVEQRVDHRVSVGEREDNGLSWLTPGAGTDLGVEFAP